VIADEAENDRGFVFFSHHHCVGSVLAVAIPSSQCLGLRAIATAQFLTIQSSPENSLAMIYTCLCVAGRKTGEDLADISASADHTTDAVTVS